MEICGLGSRRRRRMYKMGKVLNIQPVTRIEGHARISVHLNDDGNVENAYHEPDVASRF